MDTFQGGGVKMLGFVADKMMFPGVLSKPGTEQRQSFLFFKHENSRQVLLYSHGNCESIALISDQMEKMCWRLGVSVCCYEYPGYMDGQGSSETQVNEAAHQILQWLIFYKKYECRHIILMGRSIGTGPTLWLASREPRQRFAAIILQSPFTSIRNLAEEILRPALGCMFFLPILHPWVIGSKYDNVSFIKKVNVDTPILFIHGKQDRVIPVEMTEVLASHAHLHDSHVIHIQEESTHNAFDEATMFLYMMHFVNATSKTE